MQHALVAAVGLFDGVDQRRDDIAGELPLDPAHFLAEVLHHLALILHHPADFPGQVLFSLADAIAFIRRQRFQLLRALRELAADIGQEGDLPVRGEHDLEPAILGHLGQPVRVFLELLLVFAAELVFLFPEILLAKRLGQRFLQP